MSSSSVHKKKYQRINGIKRRGRLIPASSFFSQITEQRVILVRDTVSGGGGNTSQTRLSHVHNCSRAETGFTVIIFEIQNEFYD